MGQPWPRRAASPRRRPACRAHRSPRARWRSTRWCAWCPARACRGCWSTKASARYCRTARCFAPWVRGGRCWGWPCMTATPTWRSPPSISTPASAAATPRRSIAPGYARSTCSATAPAGWSPWRPPSPWSSAGCACANWISSPATGFPTGWTTSACCCSASPRPSAWIPRRSASPRRNVSARRCRRRSRRHRSAWAPGAGGAAGPGRSRRPARPRATGGQR